MTELVEVGTPDLSGEALNWAVGKAEGLDVFLAPPVYGNPWRVFVRYAGEVTIRDVRYAPQGCWADGGPLIDKHIECLESFAGATEWSAACFGSGGPMAIILHRHSGETALIAACRAIVAAKLGDTVQVPKELIP
ncbi:phage protein NinX family protein [Pseudomonas putida]